MHRAGSTTAGLVFSLSEPIDLQDLRDGPPLFAALHLVVHVRGKVVLKNKIFNTRERLFYGAGLRNDVHAVALGTDHFDEPPKLAPYKAQTAERLSL